MRASASKSGDTATLKTDMARWRETDMARGGEINVARGYMLGASSAKIGDEATSNNNNNIEIPGG